MEFLGGGDLMHHMMQVIILDEDNNYDGTRSLDSSQICVDMMMVKVGV